MNTWRPDAYHGHNRTHGFFEGWYFKLIDATEQHRLAVIPGVFLGEQGVDSHAFVQVLNGNTGTTTYHRYPLSEFWAHDSEFNVRIGRNEFTDSEIRLAIEEPTQQLIGVVRFKHLTRWPVSLRSPGIMDWYTFVPFMECYHGIVSLDHDLAGALIVDGETMDFHGGRGYTEKDWGQAFPKAWVWMQTNHFEQPGVCLTASVAQIPWLTSAFRGFIVGFLHAGLLHRFASYTGATIERFEVSTNQVHWSILGPITLDGRRRQARLELVAHRDDQHVDRLHAPNRTEMLQRVLESLTSTVDVCLSLVDTVPQVVLFSGRGRNAALEVGGQVEEILG